MVQINCSDLDTPGKVAAFTALGMAIVGFILLLTTSSAMLGLC